jgi:hypothetical protein
VTAIGVFFDFKVHFSHPLNIFLDTALLVWYDAVALLKGFEGLHEPQRLEARPCGFFMTL